MLKDISLGQYFPGESVIHRLDARFKIILTTLFIVMLFVTQKALGLAVGGVFCLFAIALSRIPAQMFVKSIKPIVPILIFTSLLNLLFIDKGTVLFAWKFIHITQGGIQTSVFMVIRIIFLIAGTSLLTYTTSPIQLTDAIERLLSPLKKLHVPVHELAMMMTIALRFIPTLIEETDKIMAAQKARGADMESGGLMQRIKALIPVLIPLFVSAFRRAFDLATAMESRCYHGGEGRTKMKVLHLSKDDYITLIVCVLYLAAFITANILLPAAIVR